MASGMILGSRVYCAALVLSDRRTRACSDVRIRACPQPVPHSADALPPVLVVDVVSVDPMRTSSG
jgi:hypothetical protein